MLDAVARLTAALADRYRIEREIGAGGMATVYLAHDIKHERRVALKVLKPELAAVLGADRFVVEIKTTAALQHPHILPLYDSGTADGFLFYVMPFIDGETLRAKLDRETQLGIDESVRIATSVADALDYAHRHGVIHRDIKPENILLHEGRPMVADFGIALAVSAAAGGRMTETGLSLGTPHYMSPEQATAEKEISARSDIYSLATVLYEMLTGQPPHTGVSAQKIIMKIITEEPAEVTSLRKSVPANVAAAVAQGLEKLPADRFENAKAFADALTNRAFTFRTHNAEASGTRGGARTWNRVSIGMTVVAALLAVLLAASTTMPDAAGERPVVRFGLADDALLRIDAGSTRPFGISADGGTIVFRASTDSTPGQLWVRTIGDTRARALDGTVGAFNPAISPDGEWVAFIVANRELRKIRISGGDVVPIATLDAVSAALSWSSNDEIYLERIGPDDGIDRVNANGGRAERAIPLDTAAGETRQRRPLVLRDAGIVVYGSYVPRLDEPTLALHRISDGKRVRLDIPGIGALALIDGHLIYSQTDGTLMAVPFDAKAMRTTGGPVALNLRVGTQPTGTAVGLSEAGTLVYRAAAGGTPTARLDLVDTAGHVVGGVPGEFAVTEIPRFSPTGDRILVGYGNKQGGGGALQIFVADLFVIDARSGVPTRVTSGNDAAAASWSSDGKQAIYTKSVGNSFELWRVPVDGGAASRLVELGSIPVTSAMVPDRLSVVVQMRTYRGSGPSGMYRVWVDGSARVDTVLAWMGDGVRPTDPRVSPDARWISYTDGNTSDVWVRELNGSAVMQVSTSSTERNPVVWGRDSRHLYYATSDGLVVIELQTSPTLGVRDRRVIPGFPNNRNYDISPNGTTFVVARPIRASNDVFVAVNWADEARRAWRKE